MSASERLIINCGASKIAAAAVSVEDGNLQIDRFVIVNLDYDLSNEDAIVPSIGNALKKLSSEHKFSGNATLILPGNLVLTRSIKIPHIEESKRAQVIAFEAQQNLPYSLNEVVWDSQLISDDGVESEVLFIAAKSNIVHQLCDHMQAAGFVVDKIGAATVLGYNTLQFAYPDIDDVLLINIGARSTNLLFRNTKGFYVRNIQLGGNSLTQSIADGLGRSFARAEQIKHKFFAETEHSDDDARIKLLNACGESFIRRMSQEMTLSIVNYKRQNNGVPPKRIFLNGRGSLLKGFSEKLAEMQKIPVESFNPLQNVSLDGSIDVSREVLLLQTSEIIGEASKGVVSKPVGVNLLPESIQEEVAFSHKKPFILAAAACLALAPLPPFLSFKQANAVYSDNVEMTEAGLQQLVNRQNQVRNYRAEAEEVYQSISRLKGLVNSKSNWVRFFADLQESLHQAEDVWIDKLNAVRSSSKNGESSYEIVVEGRLLVREAVNGVSNIDQDALSNQIKSLRASFEDSEFIVSSKSPVVVFTNLHKGLYVLPFSIELVVDPKKPL